MDPHVHEAFAAAPEWSLLLGSFGRVCVMASVVAFALSATFWFASPKIRSGGLVGSFLFWVGGLCMIAAFGSLATLFVTNQFQFEYVFNHSDLETGFAYKVAGVWAGQEGSFLLWACSSALFGLLAAPATREYRRWFSIPYAMFLASLAAIQVYESPFALQLVNGQKLVPPDGNGLVPSLLNYWMVIHPPTIFLGFGSLTVLYCWAFAALATKDFSSWSKQIRPWTIVTTTLLGIGLCMGGFWAYETLGWGGFWAWDPVENTSFVPWVWGVALIHGLFIQVSRGKWVFANLLLAGTSLLTFLYGTFLTRSGFLKDTSVHSFAEMNRSALWVLVAIFGVATATFFGLWTVRFAQSRRAPKLPSTQVIHGPFHLQGMYTGAVWLVLGLGIAAGIGMSVPLIMALAGQSPKVVEEAVYHQVLVWLFIPTALMMGIGPFVTWRGLGFRELASKLWNSFAISLGLLGVIMLLLQQVPSVFKPDYGATLALPFGRTVSLVPGLMFLVWVCLFGIAANLLRMGSYRKRAKPSLGGLLTHVGVILTMLGLIFSRGLERKEQVIVQAGQPGFALGYKVSFAGRTSDYLQRDNRVQFEFVGLNERFSGRPVLYYTPDSEGEPRPTVRPDVIRHPWYDLYIALSPMVFDVGEPITLEKGQTVTVEETKVTYKAFRREGEAGMAGSRFFADLVFDNAAGSLTASPSMGVGGDSGPIFETAEAGQYVVALQRMDAGTQAVTLQFFYKTPLFPIELYYKPLTILVWGGAGIMTIGGLLAAWNRRRTRHLGPERPDQTNDTPDNSVQSSSDASVPVA